MALQVLSLVALGVAMLALWVVMLRWRYQRATQQVLSAFRRHGALSPQSARTPAELGIRPAPLFGLRDYRRMVLQALLGAGIVQLTQGDHYYLSEERLLALQRRADRPA